MISFKYKKGEQDSPFYYLCILPYYGAYEKGPDKPTLSGLGLQFCP